MEGLSPEILHEMYKHACTDGGFTGCSLSLVSKHVRSTSRSARFHSIAFSGLSGTSRQLAQFLSLFTRERATAKALDYYTPIVKHLFFAGAEGGERKLGWHIDSDSDFYYWENNIENPAQIAVKAAHKVYLQDVATLFRLVAQDLETLCFICVGSTTPRFLSGSIQCPVGFPFLRELTIVGVGEDPFISVAPSVLYPSLTHLHFDCPWGMEHKLRSWAEHAPHVTHLCLSKIGKIDNSMEDLAATGSPFKELSRLDIEPDPPPAGDWCGNVYIQYERFMRKLADLISAATISIHVLRHSEDSVEERARKIWLERIEGRCGCWVPLKKMDDATSLEGHHRRRSTDEVEETLLL
ncbi:hypothetical protein L227DRAFT_657830 [Lentinus tigrinus ALCF2SS1-6]|uniref:F-box domain-containing protein n=1 Tax=Lentinus tigrinus ALCF2SS1-6 TaxID=1328759 RepID=A0A5C2RR46_9APHY|nr:hypothetical protein L227DRAFT_657830 [Lentinus tigrinus ALCF2SS1-6]